MASEPQVQTAGRRAPLIAPEVTAGPVDVPAAGSWADREDGAGDGRISGNNSTLTLNFGTSEAEIGEADMAERLRNASPPMLARRRSMGERAFGKLTLNGIRHSMLTLVTTALGGGVLSVSYVMYLTGIGLGCCLITTGGVLAYMSTRILMQLSTKTKKYNYAALLAHCAGPVAAPVLDTSLFIYGNGVVVGYLCFLGDFIPSIMSLICDCDPVDWWRTVGICVCAFITLPLGLQKDVSALRFVAPVSIVSLLYMASVVTAKAPKLFQDHQGDPNYGDLELFKFNLYFPQAFALCVFAFNCHINVVPVAGALIRPTKARIKKVALVVNAMQILFYCLIGSAGYVAFLKKTEQDILLDFPPKDPLVAGGRVALTGTMIVAIPINLLPTIRSGLGIFDYYSPEAQMLAPSPTITPPSSPTASPPESPRRIESGRGVVAPPERRRCSLRSPFGTSVPRETSASVPAYRPGTAGPISANAVRYTLTISCLVIEAIIAIFVPGVAIVLTVLGGTVATAMMMAIPAYCLGVVEEPSFKNRAQRMVLYSFSLVAFGSVPLTILIAAGVLK